MIEILMMLMVAATATPKIKVIRPVTDSNDCYCWAITCGARQSIFDDPNELLATYERVRGKHWFNMFLDNYATNGGLDRIWLSCAPLQEPYEHADFNSDGICNFVDFAIAAKFNTAYTVPLPEPKPEELKPPPVATFYYVLTRTGTKYHMPTCQFVVGKEDVQNVVDPNGYDPCGVCHPEDGNVILNYIMKMIGG